MSVHNILNKLADAAFVIVDPGDAGTIAIRQWGSVCNIVTAAAETRTLAQPTRSGILAMLNLDTDGGDCVITVTGGFNQTADTSVTLADAGDWILVLSVKVGSSYYWRIIQQEGTNATQTSATLETLTTDALKMAVTTVNAAGSAIGNAGALGLGLNIVGAADNTKGVQLPSTGGAGSVVLVKSTVANKTLPVYPPSTGTINGGSANAAATLDTAAAGASAVFVASNATTWYTISGDLS